MARGGITATTDMTYSTPYLVGYEALASVPDCPLRISLDHRSIEADADEPLTCPLPDTMIRKQGVNPLLGAGLIITSLPYGGLIMSQAPAKYFGPVTSSRTTIEQFFYAAVSLGQQALADAGTSYGTGFAPVMIIAVVLSLMVGAVGFLLVRRHEPAARRAPASAADPANRAPAA
jgi:hypothetical protein